MEPRRTRPSLPLLAAVGLLVGAVTVGAVPVMTRSAADSRHAVAPPVDEVVSHGADAVAGYALWAHDAQGGPLRWDPCTPIRFVINPQGAPPDAGTDLRSALGMLEGASGLSLQLLGRTEERPDTDRPLVEHDGTTWRWRPVLVAWARPGEGGLPLASLDRGIALPVAVRDGDREAYVTGQIVLNSERDDLVSGFEDRGSALGATLVHEIAHVLGLDHVDDPNELMWVEPGTGPVTLGPGDLAGLRAIGAAAGCRDTPAATSGRGLTVRR